MELPSRPLEFQELPIYQRDGDLDQILQEAGQALAEVQMEAADSSESETSDEPLDSDDSDNDDFAWP